MSYFSNNRNFKLKHIYDSIYIFQFIIIIFLFYFKINYFLKKGYKRHCILYMYY